MLLLDEPTRGIDINAKKEIYALIDELAQSGLGVVMVSSELPEILGIADRIMVLCEGRKTAEFSRAEATEENVVKAALPGGMKQLTHDAIRNKHSRALEALSVRAGAGADGHRAGADVATSSSPWTTA